MISLLHSFFKSLFRRFFPRAFVYKSIPLVSRIVLWLSPRQRSLLRSNVAALTGVRASSIVPMQLAHVFTNTYDFTFNSVSIQKHAQEEGFEHFDMAYRTTARVMVVSAHVGLWELGLPYLANKGYRLTGLYAPIENSFWAQWIHKHRDSRIKWIVTTPGASRACRQALTEGRVLGIVADLPFGERGETVTLAGHRASLPLGPWHVAVRSQATIVPAFALREATGRYRIKFHKPFTLYPGSFKDQTHQCLEQYRVLLESYLIKYPEQWGVLQPFWES